LKLTDVSEVRTSSIIRAIALMMEAVRASYVSQLQCDYTAIHPRRL
jgi:hypothetical protein